MQDPLIMGFLDEGVRDVKKRPFRIRKWGTGLSISAEIGIRLIWDWRESRTRRSSYQ